MAEFVGRTEPLTRLLAAYRAATGSGPRAGAPATALVLVTGESGIGKTSLLHRFAGEVEAEGGTVVWGTCWDDERAPAWWPWTEALRRLARPGLDLPPEVESLLSPGLAVGRSGGTGEPGDRLRLLDAIATMLSQAAAETPVVVVLDDLQWGDASTLDLVRFLVRRPAVGRLLVVGAYRTGEARREVASALADLTMSAELVPVPALSRDEVAELVRIVGGESAAAPEIHRRSGGHPFLARELCRMLATGADPDEVPPAVRDVVARRLDLLSPSCAELLEVAAVLSSEPTLDVLADVTGHNRPDVLAGLAEAVSSGILIERDSYPRFAHDLYRESVLTTLPDHARAELHDRITVALGSRRLRGLPVLAGDLARHASAALPAAGAVTVTQAVGWAREAAALEATRFAFAEAAAHLARLRGSVAESGAELAPYDAVSLAVSEADLRLKAGEAQAAHDLLVDAWTWALALHDPRLMSSVALGLDQCGARFAMPRDQLVGVLESARGALEGTATDAEARVTAALARQLQHSVPTDRPRARPLAEAAVGLARDLGDPTTLAECLLAQHDVMWSPGLAQRRVEIAEEITGLARGVGQPERHAQGLLLAATAQLEAGAPSFRVTLREYLSLSRSLRQPRHDYLVRTREAALALLDGDIEDGDRLSAEAAELGLAVGDTDTGNVRMSQRLEVVRARGNTDELRAMAGEAVDWWVGIPAHAHAVAAGFLARAGDLDAADRELATVLSLEWRSDRSYMWSVFVGQVAAAAIALGELDLCRRLVDDLRPLEASCAVNGALVCFMGSHAHSLGLLHAALGDRPEARRALTEALRTHRRLGARAWEQETVAALAELDSSGVTLRRSGDVWEVSYRGESAAVRHSKGMADLAVLVARPRADVPALELASAEGVASAEPGGGDVLDRTALASYRARLHDLDAELADARLAADHGREERAGLEREQLLSELRRSTRPDGRARGWDNRDVERARKAVSARIRDAIGRIEAVLPELGRHLDRCVTTGTACRYEPG